MAVTETRVTSTVCPLDCPDACSLEVKVAAGRVVAVDGSRRNPITDSYICHKVHRFPEHLYGPDRLHHPLRRIGPKGEGRFERISWEDALETIVAKMRQCRETFGGESILPYCYGGSNGFLTHDSMDARLFRRLGASRLLRTVCAGPTGRAAAGLYGKMTGVAYDDYVHARLIVLWGVNPNATSIHLVPYVRQAMKAGAKLVVVDPRRIPLARQADLHLPLRPGTDLPLALSVIHWLFVNGKADFGFLAMHANGVDKLRRRAQEWSLAEAARVTGLSADAIETLARWYAETEPAIIRCGWGLERNRNGGSAVAAVLALPAVAGKFGVRGGGYTLSNSAAWRDIRPQAAVAEPEPETRTINMNRLGEALVDLKQPPIQFLFVYNSNALATTPHQEKVRQGLLRDDLFTVVFEQVMTDTARYADVVLPATTFLEHHELKRGYGATALQRGIPVIEPMGEARPNYEVFLELCRRLGLTKPGDPESPEELVEALLGSTGRGAELQQALATDGVAFPAEGSRPIQFVDVFPRTPSGLIELAPPELDAEAPRGLYAYQPDPATADYPLSLISPALGAWVTSTFGQLARKPFPVEIHPADAEPRGIATGDRVRVFSPLGEVVCDAKVTDEARPGVAVLPKGLWSHHTHNGRTANALAPDTLADLGGGACFNDARVQIERCG